MVGTYDTRGRVALITGANRTEDGTAEGRTVAW